MQTHARFRWTDTRRLPPLLLSLLLAGCPSGSAETETPPPDAAAPSPDLVVPSSVTVTGTRIKTYVSESGTETPRPVDLSGAILEALVPDNSGTGYTVLPGTGGKDGRFTLSGLPSGSSYYLHYYNPSDLAYHCYIHSAATSMDLGAYSGTRDGVALGTTGAALTFSNVGGLDAWASSDQLEYYSADTELYLYGTAPPSGSTALSLTQSFVNRPLITSADTAYVMQLRQAASVGADPIRTVSKAMLLPVDMPDATATTVSSAAGSFRTPPMQSAAFDYRRSQFAALQSSIVPAANPITSVRHDLYVSALRGGAAFSYGFYTYSADLLSYSSTDSSDVSIARTSFGNPFPSNYGVFGYVGTSFTATFTLPGTTSGASITAVVNHTEPLDSFTSASIVPKLGPVTNLQINGQNAQTLTAAVGTQPTLSWNPPSLGRADGYQVIIQRLYVPSGTTRTATTVLAQIMTQQTRVVLPPGLLMSGEQYFLRVLSIARPGYSLSRPFRGSIPSSTASVLSTAITP